MADGRRGSVRSDKASTAAVVHLGRASWLPSGTWDRLRKSIRRADGQPYRIRFSRAEKKIMRRPRRLRVSEWAERHRRLTMSSLPGPWRNHVTPYLVGIMDAAQHPSVRVVSVCKGPQTGVTEAIHNYVGAGIDQAPGPVLYIFPDKETAEENSRDRILPMIRSSRRLRSYLTGTQADESILRINLAHMPIYMAWASSPARLGNKPIRYAVADEVDKYPKRRSRETGPMELIDKRLTVYRNESKYFKISTPTIETGIIWQAMQEAEVVFAFWVRCPECGRLQLMDIDGFVALGDNSDPREVLHKNLGRYVCEGCGILWNDDLRNQAMGLGEWRATTLALLTGEVAGLENDQAGGGETDSRDQADDPGMELFAYLRRHDPLNIGFHLPAWIPMFNSLSLTVAARLETLSGEPDRLVGKRRNLANQIQALPYKHIVVELASHEYKPAIIDLPAQIVPAEAVALTCGIDAQKIGFYYVVRAWAWDYTSWLVQYGQVATWDDVEALCFGTRYPVVDSNRRMAIARVALDTGGSKFGDMSMTESAYWWLRKNGVGRGARCWGIKGASWPQAYKVRVSKPIDKTPSGKPIPGGLQILSLDTEKFKDAFFWRLEQALERAAMAAWLHAGVGRDYFSHITAEYREEDEHGVLRWKKKPHRRNDWLDCEIMAAAAADPEWPEGGIHLMARALGLGPSATRPGAPPPVRPANAAPRGGRAGGGYDRPSWMD